MEIRRLKEEDAGQFWHIRLQALESEPTAFGESAEEHRRTSVETVGERLRSSTPESLVAGAFQGDLLRGTVGFRRDQPLKRRHRGLIWGMFVHPECRGQGIGFRLLQYVIGEIAQIPGITCVCLSVAHTHPDARRLYLRCGFQSWGAEPQGLLVAGEYVREEHMVLLLKGGDNDQRP